MTKNAAQEFLLEKRALGVNLAGIAQKARPVLGRMGEAAGTAAMTGAGAAAFAGLVGAAGKLYSAATKTRDFNRMLEANPDLHEHHQSDPAGFNRLYSALRTMAPEFAAEPLVAGAYIRRGMVNGPADYGGTIVKAREDASRGPKGGGPATDAALDGYMRGLGMAPEGKKPALQKQVKSVFEQPAGGGDPALRRIEEQQNYYG